MHPRIAKLFALLLAIAIPVIGQQPPTKSKSTRTPTVAATKPELFLVGEIRAFAFDPTTESGKRAYAKLADQGWMECRGQELPYGPKAPYYKRIYEVLGITWGTTSTDQAHLTNFLIPDLRGEFLRGWDHGRGRDGEALARLLPRGHQSGPTDKVGTSQEDKVRRDIGFMSAVHNSTRGFNQYSGSPGTGTIVELRGQSNEAQLAITGDHVGKETIPRNVYVFYAIFIGTQVRPEHR